MTKERFEADWLAMREPLDHQSRAKAVMQLLAPAWAKHGWSNIIDLGSGTGSNLRYLAPRLPGPQQWTLFDHDHELLARARPPEGVPDLRLATLTGNLASAGLEVARATGAHLVTASALLDLVSKDWLAAVVDTCRATSAAVLFALNYDGILEWVVHDESDDVDDGWIRRAVNEHQRRDKGFGRALGPMAGLHAEMLFRGSGYRAWLFRSPWQLGPDDMAVVRLLFDGWVEAAIEQTGEEERVRAWAARRSRTIARGQFRLIVGHTDFLALPPD
ncbi:MAG: class I SAM-dependent methyltransferase [Acidobacteria bacterium]|nr:class I SAM-dependent methyltransferase [Acidobacteriota bacterium]MXZ72878.1 class I SAM-dependent methyltransferase [Acidobacteriota bacterium]MYD69989.1 class I SAM-dependent methyltransferase [Acidobacteriota bacterium]MYJ05383.1 class I SAM-dependent methyltransferase [Acidobacteriota bacterium]